MLSIGIFSTLGALGILSYKTWFHNSPPSRQTAERLKKQAEEHLVLRHYELAHQTLLPLIRPEHRDLSTYVLFLRSLIGQRRLLEALELGQDLHQRFPQDLTIRKELGHLFLEMKQAEQALPHLEAARPVCQSEEDRLNLASAQFQVGQIEGAWSSLQDFLELSCNGQLLALAGDCCFHWKKLHRAKEFYQRARKLGWSRQGLMSRLAYCLQKEGKTLEAESLFRDIVQRNSGDVPATLGLGRCYQEQGAYERALMVYQSGKAWDLADSRILAEAGVCAAHARQIDYARLYLTEAIKRGQRSPRLLGYLAYSLECQKAWMEAQGVYRQIIHRFPTHAAGYLGLAWLYGIGHCEGIDSQTGLEMAREAVQIRPNATSWEILSACEARAGNFEKAHDIQQRLTTGTQDPSTRLRRQDAMRALRNRQPLNENHVGRVLVA